MTQININSPLGRKLIEAGGKIESGMIANMRTYLLPRDPKIHTRIWGTSRTLCGRSLRHNDQWAWQFINTGEFANRLPSGASVHDDRHCTRCALSPVLQVTQEVADVRSQAIIGVRRFSEERKKRSLVSA